MNESELKKLIPWQELAVIEQSCELQKVLSDMAGRIERIPALHETDGDDNAIAQLHYFDTCGSADWYVFEVDPETSEAFGYAALSGDIADRNAEFGYIDLNELCKIARINLDLHFAGITKCGIKRKKYGRKEEA